MNAITTTEDSSNIVSAPMRMESILRHVQLVADVLTSVMQEGEHYGASFPGDKKKNLLKPGADKLCLAFQLVPSYEVTDRLLPGDHREYTVRCTLRTRSGQLVGEGLGSCSTMESKYRYRSGKRKCPACGSDAIIKTNKGRNPGGYWCVGDKGGCGANFNPGDPAIEGQEVGKVENPDPADQWNTALKVGKKRSYVDATITATAASDLFTQDLEDITAHADALENRRHAAAPVAPAPAEPVKAPAPAAPVVTPSADADAARQKALYAQVSTAIGRDMAAAVWKAFPGAAKTDAMASILDACMEITEHSENSAEVISLIVKAAKGNADAFMTALSRAAQGEVPSAPADSFIG